MDREAGSPAEPPLPILRKLRGCDERPEKWDCPQNHPAPAVPAAGEDGGARGRRPSRAPRVDEAVKDSLLNRKGRRGRHFRHFSGTNACVCGGKGILAPVAARKCLGMSGNRPSRALRSDVKILRTEEHPAEDFARLGAGGAFCPAGTFPGSAWSRPDPGEKGEAQEPLLAEGAPADQALHAL